MKIYVMMFVLPALLALAVPAGAAASGVLSNPIAKVVAMISDLQQDVIKQGVQEQKMYSEFSEMCLDRSRQLHQEIKTGKESVAQLTATIEKSTAEVAVLQEQISDNADETADAEAELKKASALRKKEGADFKVEEGELLKTVNTIERAMAIIDREGPGASLAQVENMQSVTQVLQAMVEASTVDSYDAATLTALVQSSNTRSSEDSKNEEDEEDADEDSSVRTDTSSKVKSSSIVETLEGLLDKSQTQLSDARKSETQATNAYEMLSQSLGDKTKTLAKGMSELKKSLAATQEAKATAQGDRKVLSKDLEEDGTELGELHHDCLDKATSFEEAQSSRNEELKALKEAKKIIVEATGGGFVQTSFLQVASASSSRTSIALHDIRRLALTIRSQSLMDLTNRMAETISHSQLTGRDPFGKVRSMINSMMAKLEAEAESSATKKVYCDKEMAETENNKDDKETSVEQISTKIDVSSSSAQKLKGEVSRLEKELAGLARTQAEMDTLRVEQKAVYSKEKPVLEQGLEGIKTALKVLREYYATDDKGHDAQGGAASGIVGMLEIVESDFSKGIAEMIAAEESSQSEYDTVTKENNIARATKEQAAKSMTAQHVSLDKSISELEADKAGVNDELSAVLEYFASVKKDCVAQPDSYEEKKKRREEEIAGLREAMQTLNGDTSLLQRGTSHKTLRGAVRLARST